jgi:hypothetical protein
MENKQPSSKERDAFEAWVKSEHPQRWPNPGSGGTYHTNGAYHNAALQSMWCAWQGRAAHEPSCGHVGKVQIPTATMEQEFQTHYRRGYEAGKRHAQPSKPSEWQPIETAPVEMGPILMTDGEWFAAGHVYDEDSPRQYRIHHFAVTQEYNWTPTHWMAIPALAVPTKGASNG